MDNKTAHSGERFAAWMKALGLSDAEVAAKMGIDRVYVWRVRKGSRVAADGFMWKFALAYGFDVARKLFEEEKVTA